MEEKSRYERYMDLNARLGQLIEAFENRNMTRKEFETELRALGDKVNDMLQETHQMIKDDDVALEQFKKDFIAENGAEACEQFLAMDKIADNIKKSESSPQDMVERLRAEGFNVVDAKDGMDAIDQAYEEKELPRQTKKNEFQNQEKANKRRWEGKMVDLMLDIHKEQDVNDFIENM